MGDSAVPSRRRKAGPRGGASSDEASDSVTRGVAYLVDSRGGNQEPRRIPTGTWQAGALHVAADLDSICYPMLALARYRKARERDAKEGVK